MRLPVSGTQLPAPRLPWHSCGGCEIGARCEDAQAPEARSAEKVPIEVEEVAITGQEEVCSRGDAAFEDHGSGAPSGGRAVASPMQAQSFRPHRHRRVPGGDATSKVTSTGRVNASTTCLAAGPTRKP